MQNINCIESFFKAFSECDARAMNGCYANDIVFFDPAFDLLKGNEVYYMWVYFFDGIKDFKLTTTATTDVGDGYYKTGYTASFTLKQNGRQIIKTATAHLKVVDDIITEHSDAYSLHKLCTQLYGAGAWLAGWNSFYQKRIKNKNRAALLQLMQ